LIQKIYRGYQDRSKWVRRKAAIKIQLWYRWAKAMRWLVEVGKTFLNVKSDPLFGKYLTWPEASPNLRRGAALVKDTHQTWRVEKMVTSLDGPQTVAMLEKISAYDIFHGKKPYSFASKFEHNYIENSALIQPAKYQKTIQGIPGSKNILFANICMKMNKSRSFDQRVVALTETHLLLFKVKKLKLVESIALEEIASLSMNNLEEWTVILHLKQLAKDIVLNLLNLQINQETATELVTVMRMQLKKSNIDIPLTISPSINYSLKKQAVMRFQGDSKVNKLKVKQSKADHLLIYPIRSRNSISM